MGSAWFINLCNTCCTQDSTSQDPQSSKSHNSIPWTRWLPLDHFLMQNCNINSPLTIVDSSGSRSTSSGNHSTVLLQDCSEGVQRGCTWPFHQWWRVLPSSCWRSINICCWSSESSLLLWLCPTGTLPAQFFQPGPIYSKKCVIFGVWCEAIPRQVHYLIDEACDTGKGANTVISLLHHFLGNHSLGEHELALHADNCTGQNKNNTINVTGRGYPL